MIFDCVLHCTYFYNMSVPLYFITSYFISIESLSAKTLVVCVAIIVVVVVEVDINEYLL
jgi:hypothetical protein